MPTFLHAADLHVDSPLRGLGDELRPRVREATRSALRNLVDLAIARRVSFVLLAGDVFDDEHQAIATSRFIADQLGRLDVPVFLVRGNHDHVGPNVERAFWPPNVHELSSAAPETHRLHAIRVAVHGQSFAQRHVAHDLTDKYPKPVPGHLNIGLLHTALAGHSGEHAAYAPTTPEALEARGYAYWALGHVHKYVALRRGDVRIVYPGNLQGRHARETGEKGAALVTWTGTTVTDVTHVPLDVLRWRVCALDAEENVSFADQARSAASKLDDSIREELAASVDIAVRLTIRGVRADVLADARERHEHVVRSAVRERFGDRVLIEDLVLNRSGDTTLPSVLLERLEEAQTNLVTLVRSGATLASKDLWRKLRDTRVDEVVRELGSRSGVASPADMERRALMLGRRKLEALLTRD